MMIDQDRENAGDVSKMTESKYCSGCGQLIHRTAAMCPKCGAPQADVRMRSGHNRLVAALLALLLGGIGAHKFYLGKFGQGIVYLLLCWTLLPPIIAIIEGIVYLAMSDQRFAATYDADLT